MSFYTRHSDESLDEEIFYWRKHNALHGWFDQEYRKTGGTGDFNLIDLELTEEMLERLEKDIQEDCLKPTEGFFFGDLDYNVSERADSDREAISKAREFMKKGTKVVYTSWW